jgi:glycosyltransferase involved in cell wall biosynthesis
MKIGIDIRCLSEGRKSGVEEYTIKMLEGLFGIDRENEYVLFFNSYKGRDFDFGWEKKYSHVQIRDFRFPNKLLNFAIWFFRWPKIDLLLGGVDVFFAPNINFIALSKHCKKVLTMHDLSFERFAETFSFKRRLWHFLVNPRKLCQDFDQILAVSQSTKDDVVDLFGVDPKKIKVCPPPLDFGDFRSLEELDREGIQKVIEKYSLYDDFIFFLGTIEPRKNVISLIHAFDLLKDELWASRKEKLKNIKLLISGPKGWKYEGIFQAARESRYRDDIIFTDFIDSHEKPYLYSLAKVFVYPSYFEGFGFPPLEAMASKVPVVSSNCSSMPEIIGNGALLIDPYRPFEITVALRNLLHDDELVRYYKNKGKERINQLEEETKKIDYLRMITGF